MLDSSAPTALNHPLSDERDVSQRKTVLRRQPHCVNHLHTVSSRYHRLKSTADSLIPTTTTPKMEQTSTSVTDDDAIESMWSSSGTATNAALCRERREHSFVLDDDHHSVKSSPLATCYSHSSSSSGSSFDLRSNSSDSHRTNLPDMQALLSCSSSGYDSSSNSIPDHFFASSPNSIVIPNCNLVDQFVGLHRPQPDLASSPQPSPSVSSLTHCRKCLSHSQASSDTDDDSQATTIQQNHRPRSLPIAIQQPKATAPDDDTDHSSQNSPLCHCSSSASQKARFRPCDSSPDRPPTSSLKLAAAVDAARLNEQPTVAHKNSLDHFIMSPTDKVKVQMKYQENDTKSVNTHVSNDLISLTLSE